MKVNFIEIIVLFFLSLFFNSCCKSKLHPIYYGKVHYDKADSSIKFNDDINILDCIFGRRKLKEVELEYRSYELKGTCCFYVDPKYQCDEINIYKLSSYSHFKDGSVLFVDSMNNMNFKKNAYFTIRINEDDSLFPCLTIYNDEKGQLHDVTNFYYPSRAIIP